MFTKMFTKMFTLTFPTLGFKRKDKAVEEVKEVKEVKEVVEKKEPITGSSVSNKTDIKIPTYDELGISLNKIKGLFLITTLYTSGGKEYGAHLPYMSYLLLHCILKLEKRANGSDVMYSNIIKELKVDAKNYFLKKDSLIKEYKSYEMEPKYLKKTEVIKDIILFKVICDHFGLGSKAYELYEKFIEAFKGAFPKKSDQIKSQIDMFNDKQINSLDEKQKEKIVNFIKYIKKK